MSRIDLGTVDNFPVRRAKVLAIKAYAEHVRREWLPFAFGLRARGCSDEEIEQRIDELRPAFEKGIQDVLLQVTVMGLKEGVNDNGWAERSVPLLMQAFRRSQANPAILVKEIARGLELMEQTGVYERDGKLYVPDVQPQSPITAVDRSGRNE